MDEEIKRRLVEDEKQRIQQQRREEEETVKRQQRTLPVMDTPGEEDDKGPEDERKTTFDLRDWQPWIDTEWYGPIIKYKLTGQMQEGLNEEDKRWRRWVKSKIGRFLISEIHGRDKLIERIEEKRGGIEEREKGEEKEPRLLYRENDGRWAFCILPSERERILSWLHELHGHFSTPVTLKKALGRVYWPTRSKDIAKHCLSCRNCQMMGPLRKNERLPYPILQIQPMDLLGIDSLGPISPVTKQGRRKPLCTDRCRLFLSIHVGQVSTSCKF